MPGATAAARPVGPACGRSAVPGSLLSRCHCAPAPMCAETSGSRLAAATPCLR